MKAKPYVGITGPSNVRETAEVCREFNKAGYSMSSPHIPMLGFLVSQKTLGGRATSKHKRTINRRYPLFSELPEMLKATEGNVLSMIHYTTQDRSSLPNQVFDMFKGIYNDNLCRALQLNVVWPDPNHVNLIKHNFPDMKIVIQASNSAMRGRATSKIVNKIKVYGDSIDYVLIDPSGGRGRVFNVDNYANLYSALRDGCPDLLVGWAGGFTGDNVKPRVKNIISLFNENNFCIDAESGLRDMVSDKFGDDLLNVDKVSHFLFSTSEVME